MVTGSGGEENFGRAMRISSLAFWTFSRVAVKESIKRLPKVKRRGSVSQALAAAASVISMSDGGICTLTINLISLTYPGFLPSMSEVAL